MDIPLQSVGRHSGCFRFLATLNIAAGDVHVQEFWWTYVFNSLRRTLESGVAESKGNSVFNLPGPARLFAKVPTPFCHLNGRTIHNRVNDHLGFYNKIHLYFLFQKKGKETDRKRVAGSNCVPTAKRQVTPSLSIKWEQPTVPSGILQQARQVCAC